MSLTLFIHSGASSNVVALPTANLFRFGITGTVFSGLRFNSDGNLYARQAAGGLTSPGGLQVERVGSLEVKDASRIRVKWYVAIALFNSLKLAKLTGVRD